MKTFRYVGEPANIGRWGWCKGGEVLEMTEAEAAGVEGDNRFKVSESSDAPVPIASEGVGAAEPPKGKKK